MFNTTISNLDNISHQSAGSSLLSWAGLLIIMFLTAGFIFSSPVWAASGKKKPVPLPEPIPMAAVGQVEITLIGPAGLERVDGLDPSADKFIASLVERFKLRVLALYAEPESFKYFASGLVAGQPRTIPRLAMITVPTRMDKKSYDEKAIAKEKRRYREWYSLAINTRPLAWYFGSKANDKLSEKLGVNVNFSYMTGKETRRFDEKDRSLSFSVLSSMELYGAKTDFFVTASMVNVADKLIFLSWVEPGQSPDVLTLIRTESLKWLDEMAQGNGVFLKPIEEEPEIR